MRSRTAYYWSGPKYQPMGSKQKFSLLMGKFFPNNGQIWGILSSYLGKVLLQGKFSLKKGKEIIYLIVGNHLLIFGEKVPKKKKFPFPFLSVCQHRKEVCNSRDATIGIQQD